MAKPRRLAAEPSVGINSFAPAQTEPCPLPSSWGACRAVVFREFGLPNWGPRFKRGDNLLDAGPSASSGVEGKTRGTDWFVINWLLALVGACWRSANNLMPKAARHAVAAGQSDVANHRHGSQGSLVITASA